MFQLGLLFSGFTAFVIPQGIALLDFVPFRPHTQAGLWLDHVKSGISTIDQKHPFFWYGTDWLGFAHILFAILFIGPLQHPHRHSWTIRFGMIACLLVIPTALLAGYLRDIPMSWRLIDCSFALFGIIPLIMANRLLLAGENPSKITESHTQL